MSRLLHRAKSLVLIIEFNPQLLKDAGVDPFLFPQSLACYGFDTSWIDEDRGLLPFDRINLETSINKLVKTKSSVNLYCSK